MGKYDEWPAADPRRQKGRNEIFSKNIVFSILTFSGHGGNTRVHGEAPAFMGKHPRSWGSTRVHGEAPAFGEGQLAVSFGAPANAFAQIYFSMCLFLHFRATPSIKPNKHTPAMKNGECAQSSGPHPQSRPI
ncbi:MAG TPA: hypothetical protein DDZ51_23005 [Planctomycetaceae bacterium]|nr:hypothetical protein [Planctomycetaceae bacterium]